MKVILISGKAQHGKDTTAAILRERLTQDGKRVLTTHYADLLKYICRSFFDWNGEKDEKGRQILQYVGTDVIRKKCPGFWVDFIRSVLSFFGDNWDYVLIPDTRFPNEIYEMKEAGFDTLHLRVRRPFYISHLTEEQQRHPSETALDGTVPDLWIENTGSLEDLKHAVNDFVKEKLYEQ